ncbi:unnamed protein product [Haemonchus placei]|uniref:Uncharacterized protein n=1 Tax=Haemonchus placei TaxID=6290 RepID=A0A0N4W0K7_HAEPC|nr:unnamed protein product [Haemonchus placei]
MASTVRTVEGADGGDIENNVDGSQKRYSHVENCGEVSYRLSTVELVGATDSVVVSNVDFEDVRLGWVMVRISEAFLLLHFMLPPPVWLHIASGPKQVPDWSWS